MDNINDVKEKLDQLDRDGYLLIEGALTPDETEILWTARGAFCSCT